MASFISSLLFAKLTISILCKYNNGTKLVILLFWAFKSIRLIKLCNPSKLEISWLLISSETTATASLLDILPSLLVSKFFSKYAFKFSSFIVSVISFVSSTYTFTPFCLKVSITALFFSSVVSIGLLVILTVSNFVNVTNGSTFVIWLL